jgi:NADH dehydrogenase (ubiquinone) Fe-S protein 4
MPIMSLLHKSIGSRLLASGARRLPRCSPLLQNRAYADSTPTASSDQPPGPKLGESELVRKEGPSEGLVRHQPDYEVATDYRTSYADPCWNFTV